MGTGLANLAGEVPRGIRADHLEQARGADTRIYPYPADRVPSGRLPRGEADPRNSPARKRTQAGRNHQNWILSGPGSMAKGPALARSGALDLLDLVQKPRQLEHPPIALELAFSFSTPNHACARSFLPS